MKKKIYQYHRITSLIVAIPLLLWAMSGFMHPIMTNIRPAIATQFLAPAVIDSNKIQVPLDAALKQNRIDSFGNFRIIHIDTNYFYQVQLSQQPEPLYLSTKNGKLLPDGNWLYAQYLAKQFLEGPQKNSVAFNTVAGISVNAAAGDCCDAASAYVLNNDKGSKVTNATLVTAFDNEYKSINRLLPVYKVSFERADGIRIYVETTQDRFAFAMNNKRAVFDTLFRLFHLWGWLDWLGKGRLVVEFLFVFLAFSTTLMGLYIFCTTKSKKPVPALAGRQQENTRSALQARRNHRFTAVVIALFTLLFTFSGGYHALSKLTNTPGNASSGKPILNASLVHIHQAVYWQVTIRATNTAATQPHTDLMKDKQVPVPERVYINTDSDDSLPQGDAQYARYLATLFSNHPEKAIVSVSLVRSFNSEYNFTDKRLPVYRVGYTANSNERFFVETGSGQLAKQINDNGLRESYSFAFFHKHEFMGWGGKTVKDISTMFWAMAQVVMVTLGLVLYFTIRKRKRLQ
ncbi:hypothetical protein F5148DRAFT_1291548 [Russula earlei]|uniref:Uncharacterized protein n=1 Tax=Russula earlei TaxID=71964 RepID=A0ACC0TU78_9AGAM|nr:hypothetical protein F5148DRAFT_1291548 [Russula earlei]